MKQTKRRTEITIETHRLTIIRTRSGTTGFRRCPSCDQETIEFRFSEAALIFGVRREFLETVSRSNTIHRTGEAGLCGNSLANYFKREIRFVED